MEIARHWRLNSQRYQLRGTVCESCGKASIGERIVCGECRIDQNSEDIYISIKPTVTLETPTENTIK